MKRLTRLENSFLPSYMYILLREEKRVRGWELCSRREKIEEEEKETFETYSLTCLVSSSVLTDMLPEWREGNKKPSQTRALAS